MQHANSKKFTLAQKRQRDRHVDRKQNRL